MRGTTRVVTSVSAAAVLAVVGLTGCSGGDDDGGATASPAASSGTSSSTATATASGAAASPSAAAVPAPEGTTWVETRTSGLRFAVPDDWRVFDAETLAENRDEELVKELTETFDVTEEQLVEIFGRMDLMVVGPPQDDFAPNVNVVPNALTAMPKASELAAELGQIGATTGTPRDETTPLGAAIVVPYTLESGGTEVKGRSVVVKGPDGFVTVTVSHVSDSSADDVTSTILSTIGAT